MGKPVVFCLLCALSILAAGVFGALHNQVSYWVGPEYFHHLKFIQFAIPEAQHNRLGAALVGWRASWWMGVLVGLPAFLIGYLVLRSAQTLLSAGIGAVVMVVCVAALAALSGLAFGLIWVDAALAQAIAIPPGVGDKVAFLRAGIMHDMAYFGGLLGAVIGIFLMLKARKRERTIHET